MEHHNISIVAQRGAGRQLPVARNDRATAHAATRLAMARNGNSDERLLFGNLAGPRGTDGIGMQIVSAGVAETRQ